VARDASPIAGSVCQRPKQKRWASICRSKWQPLDLTFTLHQGAPERSRPCSSRRPLPRRSTLICLALPCTPRLGEPVHGIAKMAASTAPPRKGPAASDREYCAFIPDVPFTRLTTHNVRSQQGHVMQPEGLHFRIDVERRTPGLIQAGIETCGQAAQARRDNGQTADRGVRRSAK
jgi:hypothetical protein